MNLFDFFTDPVLRAPTIGSMLMCLSSSLVGVVVFLRKRSLVGEALSHAAYPGVVLSVLFTGLVWPYSEDLLAFTILAGAFATAFLGLKTIDLLERKFRVKNDSALTFVLSVFLGIGVLVASRIQISHALWYKQAQIFLYGQTATMTDIHILIYGGLSLLTACFIFCVYRHLEAVNFDRGFAQSIGIRCKTIDNATFFLLVLAIVIGIRSVGVALMAGMLIAPAAAARPFSSKLSHHFFTAGFFGLLSGFSGNVLSVVIPQGAYPLPTGPMILLSAATFCLLALLFAPQSGMASRYLRKLRFHTSCRMENGLKALWKDERAPLPFWVRLHLSLKGWTSRGKLTPKGKKWAEKIVRLHRLWEVYLVDYMGQRAEKVHRNAEELEHWMTPELEMELTELLQDPKQDPHHQPIPPRDIL
jgi:manganese/zinc/iron transport system permease protein